MEPVDPPHDSLRPLDGTGDERFGSRAGTRLVQILGILEVPSDEYAGYDRQNAFASFFHPQKRSIFAICSPYRRPLMTDLSICDYD